MSRQKVRLDQLVVLAGTPDGYVPTVAAGELVLSPSSGALPADGSRMVWREGWSPTAADAYMTGHVVSLNGELWVSTADDNGTTPGDVGASWVSTSTTTISGGTP